MSGDRHPALAEFDAAVVEHEARALADEYGYGFAVLVDGVIALAPPDTPPAAVLALVLPDEIDDDAQMWFDDYRIRVDTTGRGPAVIYVDKREISVGRLELHARALLSAIAIAREAD